MLIALCSARFLDLQIRGPKHLEKQNLKPSHAKMPEFLGHESLKMRLSPLLELLKLARNPPHTSGLRRKNPLTRKWHALLVYE
jgi:hypothetical protein